jgi:hypothetical protein
MSFRFMKKCSLVVLLGVTTTTLAYAAKTHDPVPCPSLTSIQQTFQNISSARRDATGKYEVSSRGPVFQENNLYWDVSVENVVAKSFYHAVKIGRETVQSASTQQNQNADQNDTLYICYYGPGEIQAVGHQSPGVSRRFKQ